MFTAASFRRFPQCNAEVVTEHKFTIAADAESGGFVIDGCEVEFTGVCPQCVKNCAEARTSYGGASPRSVKENIRSIKKRLAKYGE